MRHTSGPLASGIGRAGSIDGSSRKVSGTREKSSPLFGGKQIGDAQQRLQLLGFLLVSGTV